MTANTKQIGGTHYAKLAIQPMEYALKNNLNYAQANAIKYITRYKDKNGIEDLRKAIHCIELLIQHETERAAPEWPSEERIDAIGQNGATAEHYKPELLAIPDDVVIPDWVEWIVTGGRAIGADRAPDQRDKTSCTFSDQAKVRPLWSIPRPIGVIPTGKHYERHPDGFELVLD